MACVQMNDCLHMNEPIPFAFGEIATMDPNLPIAEVVKVEPPKKSVRFCDEEPRVHLFSEDRKEKIVPKKSQFSGKDDFPEWSCKNGAYLEGEDVAGLYKNTLENKRSPVDDPLLKESVPITPIKDIHAAQKVNYMSLKDPMSYVTTKLLLGECSVKDFPVSTVLECLENVQHILEQLEEPGSFIVISYIDSFSVCNYPGKNHRNALTKRMKELMNQIK